MDGLKASLSFDAVAYDYDDEYLTIDTDTHTININNVSRLFGVQYDGNSKLIKFRIRNKLSDIQKMQDSIVYINWIDSKGVKGQSIAINKTINNDTCEFAWKVPFDALKNSGVLHFAMSAVMTKNSSSVIDQRWSTQIASVITPDGIYIKSYTPSSEEEDRIAQIYNELSNMINKQNDNLQSQINSLEEDITNIKKKKNVILYVGSAELSDEQKISCDYVCDGVDDQIEINQAIDSLPDSGGEIHLSRGIFNITAEININKRIKLVGEGKGITLDRNSVNNGGTTLLSELTGGSIITIKKSDTLSDIKGITLSDFQIVGAGINVENNYCNGINVETYTDCVTLERLAICHCFYGLFVDQTATVDDISVTNCDFQRDTTGIFIYGQGWQTRIENNIFWDMSGRQATSGIVLSAGKNIVNGNYFGVSSLVFQGRTNAWISAKNAVSLLCNGNSFSRCTSSPIRFEAGGQFASISGNSFSEIGKAQFQNNERAVLYVDGNGTGGGRISFTDNTVFWSNDDTWKTSYLAYLTNQVAQVNISNNTVIDGIGKINEDELVYKSEDSTYAITIGNNVLC